MIIIGVTGVGKSELSQFVVSNYADNIPAFKVEFKRSINNNYEEGSYLREIAKNIHIKSKVNGVISLIDFIKRLTSNTFRERIFSSIRQEFIDNLIIGKNIIKEYSDVFFNEGAFNVDSILNSYNAEQYSLMKEYISHIFRENCILLNIENIQNIDKSSFIDIVAAFIKSKGSLLLIEYTPMEGAGYTLTDIIVYIEKHGIEVNVMNVKPLKLNDVKQIIDNQPKASWELIKNSFISWNGNLKPIVDLLTCIKYDNSYLDRNLIDHVNDFTEDVINSLQIEHLQLLILLAEHIDPVDTFLIQEIIDNPREIPYAQNVLKIVRDLEKKGLIKKDKLNRYSISHDSIIFIIQNSRKWLRFKLNAKSIWYDIYKSVSITTFVPKSIRLSKILYFASALNHDNVVVSYLDDIYIEALKCKNPESLIEYVLSVRIKLKKDISSRKKIDSWLISLYYNLAYSAKAITIIEDTEAQSPLITLITILVLEDLGFKDQALMLCNEELKLNNPKNLNYELALRTTRLMINFVIGNHGKALLEYNELYGNLKYVNLFEYGFLLRNVELIYSETSFQDSLSPIWESVIHFKKFKATKMEAYSRVTYGVQIALTGKFQTAIKQFEIAGRLLRNIVTERHSILNNISVVNLYQGNYNDDIKILLNQSINFSRRGFDTAAIYMNYLALLDWRNEDEEAEQITHILLEILDNRTFRSIDLTAGCYYNIYKFYEKIGNLDDSQKYKNQLLLLPLTINKIWRHRLHNEFMQKSDNDYVESIVNRCLSFISNWNLEVDNTLMQYE